MSPALSSDLVLLRGGHAAPDDGLCVMEAVAFVAGEPHSDHPACASEVIGSFLRAWNDAIQDDDRRTALLKPLIPRLVGSRGSAAVELQRSRLAIDWMARYQAPAYLDLVDELKPHATTLRALSPLDSDEACERAQPALSAAESAAESAAWSAAGSAAWSAAWSAAESAALSAAVSAAWSAAWSAAESAARSAAWGAARSAAWSAALGAAESAAESAAWSAALGAAGSAAGSALRPTVEQLQASALDLVERMLAVTD